MLNELFLGFDVNEEQLKNASTLLGILDVPNDYLEPEMRTRFEEIVKDLHEKPSKDYVKYYLELKYAV